MTQKEKQQKHQQKALEKPGGLNAENNSPQRLACLQRAVRCTDGEGDRPEHTHKFARPAAAATARNKKNTAMDNSPQRLVCVRRAVRATGGRGDREEHNGRATRPAAAATSRKGNKTQNLRLEKLVAAAFSPPESCACYRSCKQPSRTHQKIRAACARGNSEKQQKKAKTLVSGQEGSDTRF